LLETIRQYGLERLRESGEDEGIREGAAAWCLALAERAEPELKGSHARTWLDALDRELDNIRGAISWWLERRATEPLLRLAGALWAFCEIRGHMREGRAWLTAALDLDDQSGVDPRVRSKALHGACILSAVSGDYPGAIALQEANLSLNRGLGNTHGVAMSLLNLTNLMRCKGEAERAIAFGSESLSLFRELGEQRLYATTLNNVGMAHTIRRAFGAARAALEEALAIFRALDCPRQIGSVLDNLGDLARLEGNYGRAEAQLIESVEIFHALSNPWDSGVSLEGLAQVAVAQGQTERAARLFGAAEAQLEAAGAALEPSDRPEHDRAIATLRVRLGPDALAAHWAYGRSLSLDGALELARDTTHRQKQHREPTRIAVAQTVALEGSPLTDREREVAALVVHGLTNRQIADALVITKQTADKHVGNILGKLGVASRAQVAVWVVQHGVRPLAPASAA
jgi:DNA-binding CsgD family transcriptional regulator